MLILYCVSSFLSPKLSKSIISKNPCSPYISGLVPVQSWSHQVHTPRRIPPAPGHLSSRKTKKKKKREREGKKRTSCNNSRKVGSVSGCDVCIFKKKPGVPCLQRGPGGRRSAERYRWLGCHWRGCWSKGVIVHLYTALLENSSLLREKEHFHVNRRRKHEK